MICVVGAGAFDTADGMPLGPRHDIGLAMNNEAILPPPPRIAKCLGKGWTEKIIRCRTKILTKKSGPRDRVVVKSGTPTQIKLRKVITTVRQLRPSKLMSKIDKDSERSPSPPSCSTPQMSTDNYGYGCSMADQKNFDYGGGEDLINPPNVKSPGFIFGRDFRALRGLYIGGGG